jgi:hypothetical protein
MTCPICDHKPMNCDCTPRERAMWRELQEREDTPTLVLTSAERGAIGRLIGIMGPCADAATLRGLLERLG